MKLLRTLTSRCYFTLWLIVLFSVPAFAYLDPGTLTYVLSMVAALFVAGGAALAIFRRKIVLFFRNLGKKDKTADVRPTTTGAEVPDEVDPMADVVDPMAGDGEK